MAFVPLDRSCETNVPEAIRVVFGTGKQEGSTEIELYTTDLAEVASEGLDAETTANVPKLDRLVLGSTDNEVSKRVEDDRRDRCLVACEALDNCSPLHIKQVDSLVITSTHEVRVCGVEFESVDVAFMTLKG